MVLGQLLKLLRMVLSNGRITNELKHGYSSLMNCGVSATCQVSSINS